METYFRVRDQALAQRKDQMRIAWTKQISFPEYHGCYAQLLQLQQNITWDFQFKFFLIVYDPRKSNN